MLKTPTFIWIRRKKSKELEALQYIAADLLRLNLNQLKAHVDNEALQEICHDDQD